MLPFDDAAAARYGAIRGALENAGKPIGPLDMQIAAIALVNDLTVVTRNTPDFAGTGVRLHDPVLPMASFAAHHARLSGDQSWTTTSLPTGHDAMITRPDLVADLLIAQTV
jgi:hypothetical protein